MLVLAPWPVQGERKFVFVQRNPLNLETARLILTLVSDYSFDVYKIMLFLF